MDRSREPVGSDFRIFSAQALGELDERGYSMHKMSLGELTDNSTWGGGRSQIAIALAKELIKH